MEILTFLKVITYLWFQHQTKLIMSWVSIHLFPEVAAERADEDGVQWYSECGVDKADPASPLRLEHDPPISDALDEKVRCKTTQNIYTTKDKINYTIGFVKCFCEFP